MRSTTPTIPWRLRPGNRGFPRNSRNLNEERGNSDNDIRHVAVINYLWELPFGKGKGFLNTGFVGKVFEGWQFSGITTVQTGHPFDVFTSTDMERTGLSGRADLVGNPYAPGANTRRLRRPAIKSGLPTRQPSPAAPTAAARRSTAARELPAATLLWTGFCEFRSGVGQDDEITERVNAELRVEGYNIFNHPHFNNPGTDLALEPDYRDQFRPDQHHRHPARCNHLGAADAGGAEAEFLEAKGLN